MAPLDVMLPTAESIAELDIVQTFRAELYAAFGAHFDLWIKEGEWIPVAGGELQNAPHTVAEASLTPTFISALDHAAAAGEAPRAVQQANGRWLLAIKLPREAGSGAVATASFSTDRPDLLERTARVALDAFQQTRSLHLCRKQLDNYASNMTKNLEELAYLCGCAEHIDLASSSPDVWKIAVAVLPRLRETVNAAAIVLFPLEYVETNDEGRQSQEFRSPIWEGDCEVDEATCLSLIRQFSAEFRGQPVVRNYFADSAEKSVLRDVQSFVLTPVAKGDFDMGWLLALNRIHTNVDDLTYLHRAHAGLSDLEFGTVEAHLLQFTAALLAAHGRNAALLRSMAASG